MMGDSNKSSQPLSKSDIKKLQQIMACSICGEGNCDRDRIINNNKPWDGLLIPEKVDIAVEEVSKYCLILYNFYYKIFGIHLFCLINSICSDSLFSIL